MDFLIPMKDLDQTYFKDPPARFSPIPFWFWNGDMNRDKMLWELKEFRDKGISSLFIHARFGLNVPYLSPDWFNKVSYVVERARELGIKIWIYDEYNWPSGTAGLEITKRHPELREKVLQAVIWRFKGPLFAFTEMTDSRYIDLKNTKLLRITALPVKDLKYFPKSVIDLTPKFAFGSAVSWESPEEDVYLMWFVKREVEWYIDPFNPAAVQKFLEYTHEKYRETLSGELGSTVLGFYTDEPAYYYYITGSELPTVPWSDDFPKLFREMKGYDLVEHLPALFIDVGDKTAKIRCDFWEFVTKLYSKTFYENIKNWCHKNGVLFVGHLLFEDDLRRHVKCEGNVFEHLKHLDVSGADHLYAKIGTVENPAEHVAPKIASSAAHHYGQPRTLCESFGGIYWDADFERMKWLTDWEYVLGVDLLNPHGFHYSIEGDRKRDWPPSQFYHHPFWKYYKSFSEYVARLSYMLAGGKHIADVLLLFPIVSLWANYVPHERNTFFDVIERDFYYLTDALLRMHRDYDYVDEETLQKAEIVDGKIKIGQETYRVLFLPPITTLKSATLEKIIEFYEKGGKIVSAVLLPFQSAENGNDETLCRKVMRLFKVDPRETAKEVENSIGTTSKESIRIVKSRNAKGGEACFIRIRRPLNIVRPDDTIQKVLSRMVAKDVDIDSQEVFCIHKVKGGKDIYFLTNLSEKEQKFMVRLNSVGRLEVWNPEKGEVSNMPVYRTRSKRTEVPLRLPRHGSAFLVLQREEEYPHVSGGNLKVERLEKIDDRTLLIAGYAERACQGWVEITYRNYRKRIMLGRFASPQVKKLPRNWRLILEGENALLLKDWRVKLDYDCKGLEEGWHKPDYDDSRWISGQCGPLISFTDKLPGCVWYRSRFIVKGGNVSKLLVDGISGRAFKIFVNGQPVQVNKPSSNLDVNIGEASLEGIVQPGENVIAVQIEPMSLGDGLLDPVRILGMFIVRLDEKKPVLEQLSKEIRIGKSWTEQGLPYYSGSLIYQQNIYLPASLLNRKILLDCSNIQNILEVEVNGNVVELRLWPPYVVDVTKHLKEGVNEIRLRVTNTAANIITGSQKPSGILSGVVKLIGFEFREARVNLT